MAAQVLISEGYGSVDPSHPLGGKDGGKDAVCNRHGKKWVMAVYFPRGQQPFTAVKKKFLDDLDGVATNKAVGLVFVTNQELRLAERDELVAAAEGVEVELYHLERVAAVLDAPKMAAVKKQFLGIDLRDAPEAEAVKDALEEMQRKLIGVQTGGDSFCYWMLYHFDLGKNVAQNFVIIRKGEFPLYDVRFRIRDMDAARDVHERNWGELNSPADFILMKWPLPDAAYYRVFFHARNGAWSQDLILRRVDEAGCWLAATRVRGDRDVVFEHIDNEFDEHCGEPQWRS